MIELLEKAFTENRKVFYSSAMNLTKNYHDANDLVQIALLKACKNIQQLKDEKAITSWILHIIKNEFVSIVRTKKHTILKDASVVYEIDEDEKDFTNTLTYDAPQENDHKICIEEIQQKIKKYTTPNEAFVLKAFYFENFTLHEIAEKMGKKFNNVKLILFRGRNKLRKVLKSE